MTEAGHTGPPSGSGAARRVLVVAAMPVEIKPFVRKLSMGRGTLGGRRVYLGTVDRPGAAVPPVDVVAAVVGIGPARARQGTEALLQVTTVDYIVMIGVAGALDPSLQIGDLIVPAEVWDADTLSSHHPVPVQAVATAGILRTSGEMQTDPQVLAPDRERGVVALDMETSAVAAVSENHGIAFSAFRTISDRVQDGIVDASTLEMTNPDGSANVWGAIRIIARKPSMLRKLTKLARDVRRATEAAAAAGVRECQAIAAR